MLLCLPKILSRFPTYGVNSRKNSALSPSPWLHRRHIFYFGTCLDEQTINSGSKTQQATVVGCFLNTVVIQESINWVTNKDLGTISDPKNHMRVRIVMYYVSIISLTSTSGCRVGIFMASDGVQQTLTILLCSKLLLTVKALTIGTWYCILFQLPL